MNLLVLVQLEMVILLFSILFCVGYALKFEYVYRRKVRAKSKIKSILLEMVAQEIYEEKLWIEPKLRKIELFSPVVAELDKLFEGWYWQYLKGWIFLHLLREETFEAVKGKKWIQRILALKGLSLLSYGFIQNIMIEELMQGVPFTTFIVLPYFINKKDKYYVQMILEKAKKESPSIRFFYLDYLTACKDQTYRHLQEILEKKKDELTCELCLRVLGSKGFYLPYEKIQPFLHSPNLSLQWWAIRSIANNPTQEAVQECLVFLEHSDYRIRFVSLFVLAEVEAKVPVNLIEKVALHDCESLIRTEALWLLKALQEEQILENIAKRSKEIAEKARYVLENSRPDIEKKIENYANAFFEG